MYPPKVEDRAVQAVIRDLSQAGQLPTGAAVRTALAERYGSRGGVARIYRLLAQERMRVGGTTLSPIGIGLVEQENRNLRELLKHQRHREDAHQAHWDREVGQLRDRVGALEALVQQTAANGGLTESVKREVEGAGTRAEQLDVQLRAFGPATGRR
jgi:hypothetical protein